jgi:RHS repeat-associated protein
MCSFDGLATDGDTTYTYDVDLKRIKKDVSGTVQKFIYDGANVVVEYDGNNSLLATYLTPGLDENLSMTRNSATYYYHSDGLGSIRNLTDSSEVAQNTYDYYAFGSVIGTPTENITNDYRFTCRRWDAESNLYYYRARMYAPTYGRFLTPDPLGPETASNLYLYVLNRPVNARDPQGLWCAYGEGSPFLPCCGPGHGCLTSLAMAQAKLDLGCRVEGTAAQFDMDRPSWAGGKYRDNKEHHCVSNIPSPPANLNAAKKRTDFIEGQLDKAVELWCKGEESQACRELGKGFHTLQDCYAHYKGRYGTLWEDCSLSGLDPDFGKAWLASNEYADEFIDRINDCPDDDDGDSNGNGGDGNPDGPRGGGPTGDWFPPWVTGSRCGVMYAPILVDGGG